MTCLDGATLLAMDDLVEFGAVTFSADTVAKIAVLPVEMIGISKITANWDDIRRIT